MFALILQSKSVREANRGSVLIFLALKAKAKMNEDCITLHARVGSAFVDVFWAKKL